MKNRTRKRLKALKVEVVPGGTVVTPRPVMARRRARVTRGRVQRAVLGWVCVGLWLALVAVLGLVRGCGR